MTSIFFISFYVSILFGEGVDGFQISRPDLHLQKLSIPSLEDENEKFFSGRRHKGTMNLWAKKRKRAQEAQDMQLFNQWYDRVDKDATPDDVFWDEMERQKRRDEGSSGAPRAGVLPYGPGNDGGSNIVASSTQPTPAPSFTVESSNSMSVDAVLQSLAYASTSTDAFDDDSDWGDDGDIDDDKEMELERKLLDEELDRLLADDSAFEDEEQIWDRWAGTSMVEGILETYEGEFL